MENVPLTLRTRRVLIGLFCVALAAQFFFTTRNWTCTFMPGHEFRQAQTAIVSYYIDKQDNFSLLYETPILGKPWVSILLEVPVYQWAVVGLSRLTGWSHLLSARTISLVCFYAALPALYLLLGRLRLESALRLLVLTFVVLMPVYVFYSRAFLMESMVVMCCAWFLLGFVRTMDERRWIWLVIAMLAGTGAALIKSITYAVWLLPGATYGCWHLVRAFRAGGAKAAAVTAAWGAATVALPLGALRAWIAYTDPIKEAHASAYIFASKNLSLGNWGLFDLKAMFGIETWRTLFARWNEALMSPWVVAVVLVLGLAAFRPVRVRVLGVAAVFFGAQLLFPYAYAYQDYYYYACAVFLAGAVGLVTVGAVQAKWPRWGCALLIGGVLGAQGWTYGRTYFEWQTANGRGGYAYTDILAELTPRDSVIVVAGNDWAAMAPLYAQRKALMVRNGLQYDMDYLSRAFKDLDGEDVSAVIVTGEVRGNNEFLNRVAEAFDLDASRPTFSDGPADIYVRRIYAPGLVNRLRVSRLNPSIVIHDAAPMPTPVGEPFDVPAVVARTTFPNIIPGPFRARFQFGIDRSDVDGHRVLSAHPDADVWVRPPVEATRIVWEFGFQEPAYTRDGDRTNGAEFVVTAELNGQSRTLIRRVLRPDSVAKDRGLQREEIAYRPESGEVLRFSTRSNGNYAYDWVYWRSIEVR